MKTIFLILISTLLLNAPFAQVTLYTESFETDGEGSSYFSNTYSFCAGSPGGNPDYFLRTNTNPALPPGCSAGHGTALTNLQGSFYWASEDIRSNTGAFPGALPPGDITTKPIMVSGYSSLKVSLFLATSNNNNIRWEDADSINIKASFDGINYTTVGRFMGDNAAGGRLRIDYNLDGAITGADAVTNCDRSDFTKYTFNIPGTGTNLRIKLDFDQWGGTEELGVDVIEVTGIVVLPIKLLHFTAQKKGNNQGLLNWQTDAASTPAFFEIEKSSNGTNFMLLSRIAAGTESRYQYSDAALRQGKNYYRLKMIDASGEISYSHIAVLSNLSSGIASLDVFPNPATDRITISTLFDSNIPATIAVFDVSGRQVKGSTALVIPGQQSINVETKKLADGIYFIKLIHADGAVLATGKFIKQSL